MNKETDLILESLKSSGTNEMDLPYIEVKGDSVTIDGSLNVDDLRIIVSELEKQKPRTKTEFVREESFKDVLKCAIDGEVFYSKDGSGEFKFDVSRLLFVNHKGADVDISHLTKHCFYRKVETEIDERQEFIDEFNRIGEAYILDDKYDQDQLGEFLFDNGFKLVE